MRRLVALCLLASCVAVAEPATVKFSLDQPFTLAFGDTGEGPSGLRVWFSGSGPSFTITEGGVERSPVWAPRPREATTGPLLRAHLGDHFLTVEAMPDADHARLRLTRAKLGALTWSKPLELGWGEFVLDPDGGTWALTRFEPWKDSAAISLSYLRRGAREATGFSLNAQKGRAEERDGEFLLSLEHDLSLERSRGVRLTVRRPKAEVKPLVLNAPVSLIPDESAAGAGLKLKLIGYGHKLDMDRRDLPFVEAELQAGGEERSVRFWREKTPSPVRFRGYEVRMTACEDSGPPHSSTAKTTFVVVKAPPGEED